MKGKGKDLVLKVEATAMARNRNSRRGQIFIMVALGGVFFFLLAAGMVDWIYIFSARARLITAVDAAAIAATRELVNGQTLAEQQTNVDRIVDMIFRANFPDNFMMSTSSSYDPPVLDSPGPGMKRVRITGHAELPTFFMRIMGRESQPIAATAEAVRRDSNVELILDRSGSMGFFSGAPWANLQVAAPLFVDQFSEQNDRMGLVFYATNSFLDYTIQYPKGSKTFKADITDIVQNDYAPNGWTNLAHALYTGYKDVKDLGDTEALNVIVLFTDGNVTALSNTFPVATTPSDTAPWCEALPAGTLNGTSYPAENPTPRIGTIAGEGSNREGPFAHVRPAGSTDSTEKRGILNCWNNAAGTTAFRARNPGAQTLQLVLGIPDTWTPYGWTGSPFSSLHAFNSGRFSVSGGLIPINDNNVVVEVGQNLLLNIAERARQENILIYTIGLGPDVSRALMEAVANDFANGTNPYFTPQQPSGEYVFAEDSDALITAFLQVATSLTHLTK